MTLLILSGFVLTWAILLAGAIAILMLIRQYGRVLLETEQVKAHIESLQQVIINMSGGGAPPAPTGLAVGSEAPDFELSDLFGNSRRRQEFLGEPAVVAFFNSTCGFCQKMAPQLGELPTTAPRLVLVSRGTPDDMAKFATDHHWRFDVLLEDGRISQAYGITGTPMGYLLDPQGRIASPLAVGADGVLALLHVNGEHAAQKADLTADSLGRKERDAEARIRAAGLAVRESTINRRGLTAGTPAPDFVLPGLDGRSHSLQEFRGHRVLLVFSDVDCGPCQLLAPKLARLSQETPAADLSVLMVSRGDVSANQQKDREHGLNFPVLLQRHWEVSKQYEIFGTPVGYLVDPEGILASDAALGGDAILALGRQPALQRI